ncbi:hypothetical protein LBMAG28_10920 [Methylophilaceae bacterium]|nr:hypothetical protein LBMAG28_10920 [Methylophilaceae bacterium]
MVMMQTSASAGTSWIIISVIYSGTELERQRDMWTLIIILALIAILYPETAATIWIVLAIGAEKLV